MTVPQMNSITSAAGGILVPDEVGKEINWLIRDESCVEQIASHIAMKREVYTFRRQLTSADPEWVTQTEAKPVDAPTLGSVRLEAETLALIVPFSEELIEDADVDIVTQVKSDVVKRFAEVLDGTYLGYTAGPFGDSWSGNTPAAHTVTYGDCGDLVSDINLAMQHIEEEGYDVTDMVTHPSVKALLRGLRDLNGQPIFSEDLKDGFTNYYVHGVPICFTRQVAPSGSPLGVEILLAYGPYLFVGDRLNLEAKLLTEATIRHGQEYIDLAQMDMVAIRFRIRKAFTVKLDDVLSKVIEVPIGGCAY